MKVRAIYVLLCLALVSPMLESQVIVSPPSISPGAITAGISTTITVSALVISSAAPALANGVNLLQVDSTGQNGRVIATLNDQGTGGDLTAGDHFFGGVSSLTSAAPGTIYLQISVAFRGSLRRTLSSIVPVLVTPPGLPTAPGVVNPSMTVKAFETGQPVICNEILVGLKPGVSPTAITSLASSVGGAVIGMVQAFGLYQVGFSTCDGGILSAARAALLSNATVNSAEYDWVGTNQAVFPNDPNYPQQWGLAKVNAPLAWSLAQQGVPIGIVDSGVNDQDLEVIDGIDQCSSVDSVGACVSNGPSPRDTVGHGTAVAGLAAAITNNGLDVASPAYSAFVIAEKVFPPLGTYCSTTCANTAPDSFVLSGVADAVFRNARVVNISSGHPVDSVSDQMLAKYLADRNVVLVAAAGNNFSTIPFFPAGEPTAIAIGATDQNDLLSKWNNTQEPGSDYGSWITLYSPGSNSEVLLKDGGVGSGNGTSFAAPMAAGTASLMLGANPILTAANIKTILACSADVVGVDPSGNPIRRLNMGNALQRAIAGQTTCANLVATLSNVMSYQGLTASGSFVYDPTSRTVLSSAVLVSGNSQFPSFSAALNDLSDSGVRSLSLCCDTSHANIQVSDIVLTSSNPQSNAYFVNGATANLTLPSLPTTPGTYQLMSDLEGNDPTNGPASSSIGASNCGSNIVPCMNGSSVLVSGTLVVTAEAP